MHRMRRSEVALLSEEASGVPGVGYRTSRTSATRETRTRARKGIQRLLCSFVVVVPHAADSGRSFNNCEHHHDTPIILSPHTAIIVMARMGHSARRVHPPPPSSSCKPLSKLSAACVDIYNGRFLLPFPLSHAPTHTPRKQPQPPTIFLAPPSSSPPWTSLLRLLHRSK